MLLNWRRKQLNSDALYKYYNLIKEKGKIKLNIYKSYEIIKN